MGKSYEPLDGAKLTGKCITDLKQVHTYLSANVDGAAGFTI
jgi:hypothetical protein